MNNRWMQGKFRPRNPDKYRGDLNAITYRSSWERQMMLFLDGSPEILAWENEETVIHYFDPVQGKKRRYFVDFRAAVKQHDGKIKIILIEIKPHKQTIRPRKSTTKSEKTMIDEMRTWMTNQAKWTAARAVCAEKGWEFKIVTERELFAGIDKGYKAPKKKGPAKRRPQ